MVFRSFFVSLHFSVVSLGYLRTSLWTKRRNHFVLSKISIRGNAKWSGIHRFNMWYDAPKYTPAAHFYIHTQKPIRIYVNNNHTWYSRRSIYGHRYVTLDTVAEWLTSHTDYIRNCPGNLSVCTVGSIGTPLLSRLQDTSIDRRQWRWFGAVILSLTQNDRHRNRCRVVIQSSCSSIQCKR